MISIGVSGVSQSALLQAAKGLAKMAEERLASGAAIAKPLAADPAAMTGTWDVRLSESGHTSEVRLLTVHRTGNRPC